MCGRTGRWNRVETYICISKCVPTPASLTISLNLASAHICTPSRSLFQLYLFRSLSSSFSLSTDSPYSFSSMHFSFSLYKCTLLSHSLFPSHSPSSFLPWRASTLRTFFPHLLFFSQYAPGTSSDFYNLLLVAPYTSGRPVSGAAHPEKPENRGKQKRSARCAMYPARRVGVAAVGAVEGKADSGGGRKKRKRHRGTSRLDGSSARARYMRGYIGARSIDENDFLKLFCRGPMEISNRICEYPKRAFFFCGRQTIPIDIFFSFFFSRISMSGMSMSVRFNLRVLSN